jgi:Mn2+/Fe2+ NRAMP family transporter
MTPTSQQSNKFAAQLKRSRVFRALGPGLITGAADDDPSGIATYSQAGAQFGFAITWTLLFTYPLMAVTQEISARIGRTTGKGIAANIRHHYPNAVLQCIFFWQASQEVEEIKNVKARKPLARSPEQGPDAIERIKVDTYIGMAFSNLVALAIMFTTAATLHAAGTTDIQTSGQAAEALKPIAGPFAFAIFTMGVVGTGLLAIPVLAGSAAYAIGEAFKWPTGLDRKPVEARAFYGTIVFATLSGIAVTFSPLDPIKALFWSAVINGLVAVPVMAMMMFISSNKKIMGSFLVQGVLRSVGWGATGIMAAAAIVMIATAVF